LSFFRTSTILTFDLAMGIYIALCFLCGLYLLNVYRLPHDHEPPETLGVPRVMTAMVFIALGIYLTPAIFKRADGNPQRQAGTIYEWIEAFLLPDATKSDLAWSAQLHDALKTAEKDNKLVFIDFTAINCTNCRYNESSVFSKPEIAKLFGRYVLVRLYTDNIPKEIEQADSATANRLLQTAQFGTQLPVYAIVRPANNRDGFAVVDIYDEGKINSPASFADFLKRHLATN
jgi:hypothetical protein